MDHTWLGHRGERVVVRRRLAEGGLTDVVGPLTEVTAGGLLITTGDGEVFVPYGDIVAGRVVPPRAVRRAAPHRALAIDDLERVMTRHWPAPDVVPLGDWLLRAAGGFTGRANSALTIGDPGCSLPEALLAVQSWYRERALPPLLSVPSTVTGGVPSVGAPFDAVRTAAAAAGWSVRPGASARVLTAPTAGLIGPAMLPEPLTLELAAAPDEQWLQGYRWSGRPVPPHGIAVLTGAPEVTFASIRDGAVTVAVGRGSLASGWLGVAAVEVTPAYRRRGLARAVLGALAQWGRARRARSCFVQTAERNEAAHALYLSAGFAPHHRYDYFGQFGDFGAP